MTTPERLRLRWSPEEELGEWHLTLLALPEPPMAETVALALHSLCEALRHIVIEGGAANHAVYAQVWKLSDTTGASVFSERPRIIRTELGQGVWPDRTPSIGWTEEKMADAAAAMYRGDEPELPAYHLLRLSYSPDQRSAVLSRFAGHGVLVETFGQPAIAKPGKDDLTRAPFVLPLLSATSARAAADNGLLSSWLGTVDTYLRFSAEDRGLLLLSRRSTLQLLDAAGAHIAAREPERPQS